MFKAVVIATLTSAAALCAADAQAGVTWLVNIGAPGIGTVVTNAPRYRAPAYRAPLYRAAPYAVRGYPAPVYVSPVVRRVAPVLYAAPPAVYYRPAPVFVRPAPIVFLRNGLGRRWHAADDHRHRR